MNPSPTLRAVAAPLLVAGATTALVFAAGLVSGGSLFADREPLVLAAPPRDACALPPGFTVDALGPADRAYALRRGFLCADRAAGRITDAEYQARLAALDAAHPALDADVDLDLIATDDPADQAVVWATNVRAFSSQYTDSDWSATRALGAPDVFPNGGDDPNAWASEGADDRTEFLEVGFDRPRRVRGLDIVETHNPGAVTRVELIAVDGTRTVAYSAAAAPGGSSPFRRTIDLACTDQPIAAVRVTLDSRAVPDWNEIDAIGVRPCER